MFKNDFNKYNVINEGITSIHRIFWYFYRGTKVYLYLLNYLKILFYIWKGFWLVGCD